MEDNKLIILLGIVVTIIVVIASALGIFYYLNFVRPDNPPGPNDTLVPTTTEPVATTTTGFLPTTTEPVVTGEELLAQERLEKEKRFVSSYWEPAAVTVKPDTKTYKLPLDKIKEQVANYWDVSRKINLDPALASLSQNGFVVIDNPFKTVPATDWQTAYANLKKNQLPIIITADSIAGLYQDTLGIVYRETEQDLFYTSLWDMLKQIFDKTSARYDAKKRVLGIESDLVTEANRLELAYLTVALKLLAPEDRQVKEALAGTDRYFSPLEKAKYSFIIPKELAAEVKSEVELITSQRQTARSPIFLFDRSYKAFAIPSYYQSSEKLKNYYLAVTWLNQTLFPLFSTDDDCTNCLLEGQNQAVNFVAALYLSKDLAGDQALKNRWANIYKTVGFLRGIETNLTYLYYNEAMISLHGKDYDLDKIFPGPIENNREEVNLVKNKIASYEFPKALNRVEDLKEEKGLRLLRNRFLPEEQLFSLLADKKAGEFTGNTTDPRNLPFSACSLDRGYWRCHQTALDLFHSLGFPSASRIITDTKNDLYKNYQGQISNFNEGFKTFEGRAWHDNAYLSLLWSIRTLKDAKPAGYPIFMQTPAWQKKDLNTGLAAWMNFHQEINFERSSAPEEDVIATYFPYGYIEMQPQFYAELKANVEMIMTGFASLQIITPKLKSYERLNSLKNLLDTLGKMTKKELEKTSSFVREDYDFINTFNKQIRLITGDIKKENLKNQFSFSLTNSVDEKMNGINYLIVVYPQADGKLIMALGPVFNYSENRKDGQRPWVWQKEYR